MYKNAKSEKDKEEDAETPQTKGRKFDISSAIA
jgi:hypothetical protein